MAAFSDEDDDDDNDNDNDHSTTSNDGNDGNDGNDIPISSFVYAPRVEASDLDMDLAEGDQRTLDSLEDAWVQFLIDNPTILPRTGVSKHKVQQLEHGIDKLEGQQAKVEVEMKQQLDSIQRRKEDAEQLYKASTDEHKAQQTVLNDSIQQQLDLIASADQQVTQLFPWKHFLQALDGQASQVESFLGRKDSALDASDKGPSSGAKSMRPSNRAMYFVDESSGSKKDIDLRAYHVDNALLTAQVRLMQKQVEAVDRHAKSLDPVGKFLTEHDIWSIVKQVEEEESNSVR